jgi:DNA-binding helix-turn-helix protein
MTLGENLKLQRKLNNLSQKEFAMRMHTTQQRVSEWECDKVEPSLYNIVRILKVFNISFEELVEGIDIEN